MIGLITKLVEDALANLAVVGDGVVIPCCDFFQKTLVIDWSPTGQTIFTVSPSRATMSETVKSIKVQFISVTYIEHILHNPYHDKLKKSARYT